MLTRNHTVGIAILLGMLLGYWGWKLTRSSSQTPTTRSGLLPIPEPDLGNLEAKVQQQVQQARQRFEQQRNNPANRATAYGALGMVYHAYDLKEPARACYRNAHKLAPQDFHWTYYLGHLSMEAGEHEQAIASFNETIKHLPDRHPATPPQRVAVLYHLGETHLAGNELDLARKAFEQALAEDSGCTGAKAGLGQVAAARGDSAQAVSLWKEVLKIVPRDQTLHYLLAAEYRKLGNEEQSQHHLKEMQTSIKINLAPPDPLLIQLRALAESAHRYVHQGNLAFKAQQPDLAARAFRKALAMSPEDTSIRAKLAATLVLLKQGEEARKEYLTVLEQDPKHVMANYGLGVLSAKQGSDEKAVGFYRSALETDPNHLQSHFNLANTLSRLKKYQEASAHFQKVIKLAPDNGDARQGHATCLIHLGRYSEALEALKDARTALPDHAGVKQVLARVLVAAPEEKVRDGAAGLKLARELVQMEPRLDYIETLAMAQAEVGQLAEAISLQRKILASAHRAKLPDIESRLQRHLELYEQKLPCRSPLPEGP